MFDAQRVLVKDQLHNSALAKCKTHSTNNISLSLRVAMCRACLNPSNM